MMTHEGLYPSIATENTACGRPGGMMLKSQSHKHINHHESTWQALTWYPQGLTPQRRQCNHPTMPSATIWSRCQPLEAE